MIIQHQASDVIRKLKGWAEIWSELEKTYVGVDINENWDALFSTLKLFRAVGIEVVKELDFVYPEILDQRVTAFAQEIRNLGFKTGPKKIIEFDLF